jgi:hypothetical protein
MSVQEEPVVRFIDFHRSSGRREYFERERSGISYDAALNRWIIDSAELATTVLGDPRFVVADYEGICTHMAMAGKPVENLALAYASIPLCHEGDRHRALRRSMSEHLAAKRKASLAGLGELVAQYLAPLGRPGKVELMAEVLAPLVDDLVGSVAEAVIDDARALSAISPAFDLRMGERKLLQTDAEIAKVRRLIGTELPKELDDEGRQLALLMLGHDTLLGTLGESLRHLFERESGKLLHEIDYPEMPPETGVPFVERLAAEPCSLAGMDLAAGARLRIMLQAFCYSEKERDQLRIFGVGSHSCLGRPLSLDLWRELTRQLVCLPTRVVFERAAPRTTDYVFTCPQSLHIEALHDVR